MRYLILWSPILWIPSKPWSLLINPPISTRLQSQSERKNDAEAKAPTHCSTMKVRGKVDKDYVTAGMVTLCR